MGAILGNGGFILAVIGIAGIFEGLRLNRVSAAANDPYGPGWYLLLLSVILIISGFFYLALNLKKTKEKTQVEKAFPLYGPATFCILAMIGYSLLILIPYIGYAVGTAAFLFATTRLFGEKSWVISTLLAVIAGAVFWFIFVFFVGIPMP
ncbi:MAG: tripartite tricarboxylate transporter TctB family protein [Syntrophaceae bacterium]|nr:tripartite tricarboxylate transporter TctB family protein [Syntrophaceae bacterium]